jgi:hypothetical protein
MGLPRDTRIVQFSQFVRIDTDQLQGDVNADGLVNILDVVATLSYILGNGAEATIPMDVNGDGIINVLDVVQIVNIILDNE